MITNLEKTAFFSNLSGSTTLDVFSGLFLLPLSLLVYYLIISLWRDSNQGVPPSPFSRSMLESVVLVIPLVLCFTWPWSGVGLECAVMCGLMVAQLVGVNFGIWFEGSSPLLRLDGAPLASLHPSRPAFVTHFRGAIMLLTIIVILAVDFPAFPRRMAKTESMGVSLMDFIVGAMMFSSGLSWRAAREMGGGMGLAAATTTTTTTTTSSSPAYLTSGAFLKLLQVGGMGALRYTAHTLSDQHTHVSEYGVHWNFYFSLASVFLFSQLLALALHALLPVTLPLPKATPYFRAAGCLLGALVTTLGFEALVLQSTSTTTTIIPSSSSSPGGAQGSSSSTSGDPYCAYPLSSGAFYALNSLGRWALCGERGISGDAYGGGGFFALNREGILSLPGFFSLFLFGAGVGVMVGAASAEASLAADSIAARRLAASSSSDNNNSSSSGNSNSNSDDIDTTWEGGGETGNNTTAEEKEAVGEEERVEGEKNEEERVEGKDGEIAEGVEGEEGEIAEGAEGAEDAAEEEGEEEEGGEGGEGEGEEKSKEDMELELEEGEMERERAIHQELCAAPWVTLLTTLSILSLLLWCLYLALGTPHWEWVAESEALRSFTASTGWWPNQPGAASGGGGERKGAAALLPPPPGYPASRRLANAPYTLWCAALCCTLVTLFLGVEGMGGGGSSHSPLLTSLSTHSLTAFILANLSVGLGNALASGVWGAAMVAPNYAALALVTSHTLLSTWAVGVWGRMVGGAVARGGAGWGRRGRGGGVKEE